VPNTLDNEDLSKRLSFSLLLCRIGTAFIFGLWAYGTIIRPEVASDQMGKIYYINGLPAGVMVVLGIILLVIVLAVLLGLYKKITRGILLLCAILGSFMPTFLIGYYSSTIGGHPHPTILYWASFCVLACAFVTYQLRDEDTLFTIGKGA
jgi:hypothetical protein